MWIVGRCLWHNWLGLQVKSLGWLHLSSRPGCTYWITGCTSCRLSWWKLCSSRMSMTTRWVVSCVRCKLSWWELCSIQMTTRTRWLWWCLCVMAWLCSMSEVPAVSSVNLTTFCLHWEWPGTAALGDYLGWFPIVIFDQFHIYVVAGSDRWHLVAGPVIVVLLWGLKVLTFGCDFIRVDFFFVPQLYIWGSPLLGEIFAYVTVF